MACFRPQFQIPVLIPSKHVRLLWIWRSSGVKSIEETTGNGCKRPSAAPVKLCTGAPSKCLEKISSKPKTRFFLFRRKSGAKKLDSTEERREGVQKLSLKERFFGPDQKRRLPDSCTHQSVHQSRQTCRMEDPRLKDPRYQATQGDVLLYTESPKRYKQPCLEPRPKPPPAYKLPKAVLCRMMVEASGKLSGSSGNSDTLINNNCNDIPVEAKVYRIPYEEMRPHDRKRKPFTCKEGVRAEDVPRPVAIETNSCAAMYQGIREDIMNRRDKRNVKSEETVVRKEIEPKAQRRSRIEQLKIVVREKIITDSTYPHR